MKAAYKVTTADLQKDLADKPEAERKFSNNK